MGKGSFVRAQLAQLITLESRKFVCSSKRKNKWHTSATGAESSVSVATNGAGTDDLSIDVLGLVGVDISSTATTVRNFGARHCDSCV